MEKSKIENKPDVPAQSPFSQTFFHGTKAEQGIEAIED
jgi:hypothetical protein